MSGLLLDTHAALWWWRDLPRLSQPALAAIQSASLVRVSAISAYEIAYKWQLGKLPMIGDPAVNFPRLMAENEFLALEVTQQHSLKAGLLTGRHGDPFDRLIAAQALSEQLTVVTVDPAFTAFCCKVLW